MSTARERLGRRLKELRVEKNLTQQQMADRLGVSRMAYRYYENAERTPDIEFLDNLHRLTGFTMEYLLGKTDNRSPETLGYDKTIRLKAEAVNRLSGTPFWGYLLDYVICNPYFDKFAAYAAASIAEGYAQNRYIPECPLNCDSCAYPCKKPIIEGVDNKDIPTIYSAMAIGVLNRILRFDESLCNPKDKEPSQYELRAAKVMDSYYRRNEEVDDNAKQKSE